MLKHSPETNPRHSVAGEESVGCFTLRIFLIVFVSLLRCASDVAML